MTPTRSPVVEHAIDVRCSAAHAFTVFTERIADWWPLDTHSLGAGMEDHAAVACVVEPRVGGRMYEVLDDGREFAWARVGAWQPGVLLALDWNPSLEPRPSTRVEVRFTGTGPDTCRVELTHGGFEAWGQPTATRDSYEAGWARSLALYRTAAEGSTST